MRTRAVSAGGGFRRSDRCPDEDGKTVGVVSRTGTSRGHTGLPIRRVRVAPKGGQAVMPEGYTLEAGVWERIFQSMKRGYTVTAQVVAIDYPDGRPAWELTFRDYPEIRGVVPAGETDLPDQRLMQWFVGQPINVKIKGLDREQQPGRLLPERCGCGCQDEAVRRGSGGRRAGVHRQGDPAAGRGGEEAGAVAGGCRRRRAGRGRQEPSRRRCCRSG